MASLQDQLLNAGMVDKKKAKKIEKEKRKQAKQLPKGQRLTNESREQAQQALNEKVLRDKETSRVQQEAAEVKAIAAQIKQLIEVNRLDRSQGDIAFQFVDDKKIKKMHISAAFQNQLGKGQIAIVKLGEHYELVPTVVAEKIKQRDESYVVMLNESNSSDTNEAVEDDPYADFKIPDDLMW
ncbi:DUF2058 domain-containing protein [Pseudomonadales bacterium]|jgi:uncharacterized protein YaiL (DUF2058 family)|nr:DUF2058 domain-containing protein [Pseudomonadales bacterium]